MITKHQANKLKSSLKEFNRLGNEIKPHWDMPDNFVAWQHIEHVIDSLTIADTDVSKLKQLRAMITYHLGEVEQEGNGEAKLR